MWLSWHWKHNKLILLTDFLLHALSNISLMSHQKSKLTSFILCCSLLHKNVPNRQLYRWSRMVTRKYSLNSNAAGNLNKNRFISVLERPCYSEEIPTLQCHLLLTCLVNCQTQSTNWIKTGERSASVWFLSPWPTRLKKWQKWGQSVMKLDRPPHLKGRLKRQKVHECWFTSWKRWPKLSHSFSSSTSKPRMVR